MDTRRLSFLLDLAREGTMRAVADLHSTSTSTVSQQLVLLSTEVGAPLVTLAGRGVRLTPAGKRLAAHAERILAAVDAARSELDPDAEPAGTVRISGFATAMRRTVLPLAVSLPSIIHAFICKSLNMNPPRPSARPLGANWPSDFDRVAWMSRK